MINFNLIYSNIITRIAGLNIGTISKVSVCLTKFTCNFIGTVPRCAESHWITKTFPSCRFHNTIRKICTFSSIRRFVPVGLHAIAVRGRLIAITCPGSRRTRNHSIRLIHRSGTSISAAHIIAATCHRINGNRTNGRSIIRIVNIFTFVVFYNIKFNILNRKRNTKSTSRIRRINTINVHTQRQTMIWIFISTISSIIYRHIRSGVKRFIVLNQSRSFPRIPATHTMKADIISNRVFSSSRIAVDFTWSKIAINGRCCRRSCSSGNTANRLEYAYMLNSGTLGERGDGRR